MMRAGYMPALDGLRGVSILLVVGAHAGLPGLPGAFGVTLFFFISGFLITGQLLAELAGSGRLDLPRFYLRRALRLMPAGLCYIVAAGAVFMLAGGAISAGGWLAAVFYGANIYDLWLGYITTLPGVRHPFNILWSLAIEEQFYLAWPLLLMLLWRRRAALVAVAVACVAVLGWRFWLYNHCFGGGAGWLVCGRVPANSLWRFNRLYLGTDTRLDSLAWGAMLALLGPGARARLDGSRAAPWVGAVLLVGGFLVPGEMTRQVVRTSVQGLALLLVVPALLRPGWASRALSWPPARFVGRLSYSVYLWHWGAFGVADWLRPGRGAVWLVLALGGAAVGALGSYFGIERPFLRLRRRAGSHATG